MDLTLIICTYNRASSLKMTLQELKKQLPNSVKWEILVVDNFDDHETQNVVKSFEIDLPISLIIEKKPGQNSARNAALPYIKGDIVVFTDDDITPQYDWLSSMLVASQNNLDVDVFGGRIIPVWESNNAPWQADAWFSSFVYADQDLGEHELQYSGGCLPSSPNMAIRKRVFDEGFLFNDKIGPIGSRRISGSESEFLSRVLSVRKGLYLPQSKVFHRISNNMLDRKYLRKRCYAMGLGMSVWDAHPVNEKHLPRLFGVARYRVGRFLKHSLLTMFFQFTLKEQEKVKAECQAALDLGFCIGIWTNLKKSIE